MNYLVIFSDPAEYQLAIASTGGGLLELAPRDAATKFGIPYPYPSGDLNTIPKTIGFPSQFYPGYNIGFPGPSGVIVDDTILTLHVPSQTGNPNQDAYFTWSGSIFYIGPAGDTAPGQPAPSAIPQRRWICGFELARGMEVGNFNEAEASRDSSRLIGGFGLGIRSASGSVIQVNTNIFRPGLTPVTSWERFYLRVRKYPASIATGVWACHGFPSSGAGARLQVTSAGALESVVSDSGNNLTSKGAIISPIEINKWYKIDILLSYGATIQVSFYINGVYVTGWSSSAGANTYHNMSQLGRWTGGVDTAVEIDLDDWICADLPARIIAASLTENTSIDWSADWVCGSHVRAEPVTSITTDANWAAVGITKGVLNQRTPLTRLTVSELTSITSGATLEGLTGAMDNIDATGVTLGAVAAIISSYSKNSGGTDGKLGYKLSGAAAVLTTVDQTASDAYQQVAWVPAGLTAPVDISPWSLVHTKSVDANTDTTYSLSSIVEYIGVWFEEDTPDYTTQFTDNERAAFKHNSLYDNTEWAIPGSQPEASVFSVGGTYVGNGTYQEIALPGPCHFLWIRPLTGSSGGLRFFGSSYGPHFGVTAKVIPNLQIWADSAGNFKFAVVGTNADVNANAVTYQFIAFCDPGMRFNYCGAFFHGSSQSTPQANLLADPNFQASCGFAQQDANNQITSSVGLWFRGSGSAANVATDLSSGAQLTNFGNFGLGVFNSYVDLHQGGSGPINFSLWRSADSGPGGCSGVMVQILSYTGNGSSPRTIALTPTSGKYPLFVLVVPVNPVGVGYYRDPSHTGSNSSHVGTQALSVSAITALGVDSITVSSLLNTNGTLYNVLCFPGDAAGANNGTFFTDYCQGIGNNGPYAAPVPPSGANLLPDGGLQLGAPAVPTGLLKNISGIYTIIADQKYDKLIDRNTGGTTVNVNIPDPTFKTGYIGG